MAHYKVELLGTEGEFLEDLTFSSLQYNVVSHDVGTCVLEVPPYRSTWPNAGPERFQVDRRLAVYRQSPIDWLGGETLGPLTLEQLYLIRRIEDSYDDQGIRRLTIVGVNGQHVLSSRVVGYWQDWIEDKHVAWQATPADDICRYLVRDNLGGLVTLHANTTGRDVTQGVRDICEADTSSGPNIGIDVRWRPLLDSLRDCAAAASQAGTPIYWQLGCRNPNAAQPWWFECRTGQHGIDHSSGSARPVIISTQFGNLARPKLVRDYVDEVTFGYGLGRTPTQYTGTASDNARGGRSRFARREAAMLSPGLGNNAATMDANAQSLVTKGKPKLHFTGSLVDAEGSHYGSDWHWGDRVTLEYEGLVSTSVIRRVDVRVVPVYGEGGQVTFNDNVSAALEVEE